MIDLQKLEGPRDKTWEIVWRDFLAQLNGRQKNKAQQYKGIAEIMFKAGFSSCGSMINDLIKNALEHKPRIITEGLYMNPRKPS